MPWCPECRVEYRDGFFKCADCGAWLVNALPSEKKPPKKGIIFERAFLHDADVSAEKWAQSTLSVSEDDESLVAVYEPSGRERMWLHDILDDNGIPYKIEVVPCWGGAFYYERPVILVEEEHKDTVLDYIKEYENKDNIVREVSEEDVIDEEDEPLPQMVCPFCGGEIDFDYAICPLCNKRLLE